MVTMPFRKRALTQSDLATLRRSKLTLGYINYGFVCPECLYFSSVEPKDDGSFYVYTCPNCVSEFIGDMSEGIPNNAVFMDTE